MIVVYLETIMILIIHCDAGFVPPYALKEILSALTENTPDSKSKAYYWALVTFLVHLSFAQVDLVQSWHTRR